MNMKRGIPHAAGGEKHFCRISAVPFSQKQYRQCYGKKQQEGSSCRTNCTNLFMSDAKSKPPNIKTGIRTNKDKKFIMFNFIIYDPISTPLIKQQ